MAYGSGGTPPLPAQAVKNQWPTPAANNPNDGETLESWDRRQEKNKAKHNNGNGAGTPLAIKVRQENKNWPTATVGDSRNAKNATATRHDPDSNHHAGTTLCDAVDENFPTPCSQSNAKSGAAEAIGGSGSRKKWQEITGQQSPRLNPDWVAQLMTLPSDWLYPSPEIRNRTDELRLAGNGVVPGSCEIAVRMCLEELSS